MEGVIVMAIHVMDTQIYGANFAAPEIREIFDEKSVVESWLMFEGILAEVQGELGIIPQDAAREIKTKATLEHVKIERIAQIYRKTKLASVATIRALTEVCQNGAGEYIHYGSCTPELFENTLAYRIGKAMEIFEKDLLGIRSHLNHLADVHRHTIMVDRSNGQQALPTTFGFVAAIWSDAVSKHIERFQDAKKRILMGSIKGAVGNHASHYMLAGETCLELEKKVLARLGLHPNRISFRRHMERLTEFMNLLSLLAITFEKICDDIIVQQRNEIGELQEPFDAQGQIGSSALPQKRNPIQCGAIIAWCKKIRSNASAFAETHMRDAHDIIGFYVEDLIIPETCVLTGAMLNTVTYILRDLMVRKEAMERNVELSNGMIMAEALMLALSKKIGGKQAAHAIVQKAVMEAFEKSIPFKEYIVEYPPISDHFSKEEVRKLLNPKGYLGLSDVCIEAVIRS